MPNFSFYDVCSFVEFSSSFLAYKHTRMQTCTHGFDRVDLTKGKNSSLEKLDWDVHICIRLFRFSCTRSFSNSSQRLYLHCSTFLYSQSLDSVASLFQIPCPQFLFLFFHLLSTLDHFRSLMHFLPTRVRQIVWRHWLHAACSYLHLPLHLSRTIVSQNTTTSSPSLRQLTLKLFGKQ